MPRRSSFASTTLAAFWPRLTRLSGSCSDRSSAYCARAATGKRPSVRPVSEPTRSDGQAGDQTRAEHDRVDVPVGVVVGEDRLAHVLRRAGGLEVARGGEDRVDRVVRVLLLVVVRVDAVLAPGGRHELHPAERARGRDVQVAAVVGLDLVDRGQVLPADAVLDAGGLVDRQQEERDAELADDEVRDAVDGGRARAARRRRSGWSGVGAPSGRRRRVALRSSRLRFFFLLRTLILSFSVRLVARRRRALRARVVLARGRARARRAVVAVAAVAAVGCRGSSPPLEPPPPAAAGVATAPRPGAGGRRGRGRGVGRGSSAISSPGKRDLGRAACPGGTSTVTVTTEPSARRTWNVRFSADAGEVNATSATSTRPAASSAYRSLFLIPGRFSPPEAPSEPLGAGQASKAAGRGRNATCWHFGLQPGTVVACHEGSWWARIARVSVHREHAAREERRRLNTPRGALIDACARERRFGTPVWLSSPCST